MDANAIHQALSTAAQHLQAGRLREVEIAIAPVLEAAPQHPDAHFFKAIACHQQGRTDEALSHAERAAKLSPANANILGTYGTILMAANRHDEAIEIFQRLTSANPQSPQGFFTVGMLMNRVGRFDEAVDAFTTVDRLTGGNPESKRNLAISCYEAQRYEEALAPARAAVSGLPGDRNAIYTLGKALLAAGQADEALGYFDQMNDGGMFANKALAYKEVALRELGRDEEANSIGRLEDYVWPLTLSAPEGFDSLSAFNDAICDEMLGHAEIEDAPTHRATRHGRKVSNLLDNPSPLMMHFGGMIEGAISGMQDHLAKDASDGPFAIAPPPGEVEIDLWVNIMHRQGHQLPHFHPQGWLSGCYYARVPDRVETSGDAHEGWIEFGRPAYHLPHTKEPIVRVVKPEEGLIVLFPSYLFHRTIPFESDDLRISFAFDVVPKAWRDVAKESGAEV